MSVHTQEQKAFIVRSLATYVSPDAIVKEFAQHWKDTACTHEDVAACERGYLEADWVVFFDRTRMQFLDAPTADRRIRIALLHKMAMENYERRAYDQAAKLIKQIAEEQGGVFEGKNGSGSGASGAGEPIVSITRTIVDPVDSGP